jgi:hypothetical protein
MGVRPDGGEAACATGWSRDGRSTEAGIYDLTPTVHVMRAPRFHPQGGEDMSLTPREQRLLAAIERDLTEQDPGLAGALSNPYPARGTGLGCAALRHTLLLVAGLAVLVIMTPVAAQLAAPAVALLTIAVVVPWLVSAARLARRHDDDPKPWTAQPGDRPGRQESDAGPTGGS